ncbi:rod shape-determining protein MreC [Pseudorhodoferax sp. Leaf267]|uniref:rod shape-determining protein MreC n=1 Tax=Pseudorhodoferax sp. Leaf267 TaxID=1736316 RepID=UPI0006FBC93A|nr:rod shape-determining protein MreC [Pseudorhodoferax sp. Leaf267]KQP12516.1 rod shape-determining protein MreC [Pseudorhodoferax sp. Leaf267]
MPLGTLDRTPPPFFKQGPSALTKLTFFSAFALFLMVADARFAIMRPLRAGVATLLYPLQLAAMGPVRLIQGGTAYLDGMAEIQARADAASRKLVQQSERAGQVEVLALENARLRSLLGLREQLAAPGQAAEVLYDAADPYTRKVFVDRGQAHGVRPGSPVLDASGVLGQVTRVLPLVSEVTLLIDRDQAIPVLNTRTGARSVAYGNPGFLGGVLELRFMAGNSDVQAGDLLSTSGVDGVYPPGLRVAIVETVERQADSAFARIYCRPLAQLTGVRHVMLLQPLTAPPAAEGARDDVPAGKGASR